MRNAKGFKVGLWTMLGGFALVMGSVPSAEAASIATPATDPDHPEKHGELTLEVQLAYPVPIASPGNSDEIARLQEQFRRVQLQLCDATDRNVRLKKVRFVPPPDGWVEVFPGQTATPHARKYADIIVLPQDGRSSAGSAITLFRWGQRGDVITHELGHYLLGLGDSYPEDRRDAGCGIGQGFEIDASLPLFASVLDTADKRARAQLGDVNNTIMQQRGAQQCRNAAGEDISDINPLWGHGACFSDADCADLNGMPGADGVLGTADDTPLCSASRTELCEDPGADGVLGTADDVPMVFSCENPARSSELAWSQNFDLVHGDGAAAGCPAPRPARLLHLGARLRPTDATLEPGPYTGGWQCGNGELDAGEECDGTNLNGATCASLGLVDPATGGLGCNANCTFDAVACTAAATCGNAVLDAGEACDSSTGAAAVSCADAGVGSDTTTMVACGPNCTYSVAACPGNRQDPPDWQGTPDEAWKYMSAAYPGQVEAIDNLGMVESNGAALRGLSSHALNIFSKHITGDDWELYVCSRGEEYAGGVEGTLVCADPVELHFVGATLDTVDGQPPNSGQIVELGGPSQRFRQGPAGEQADALSLELRFDDFRQETLLAPRPGWFYYSNFTSARVTHGEIGTADERQFGACSNADFCKAFNASAGIYASTSHRMSFGSQSEWDAMRAQLDTVYGYSIPPQTIAPTGAEPSVADCGGNIEFETVLQPSHEIAIVVDRSGSMGGEVTDFWNPYPNRLEYVKAAAKGFAALVEDTETRVALVTFNHENAVSQNLTYVRSDGSALSLEDFGEVVDALEPGGRTAIGAALRTADAALDVADANPFQSMLLLSDLEQNTGEDPVGVVSELLDQDTYVYTIPVGQASDRLFFSDLLAQHAQQGGGGMMLDAKTGSETPTIFAETYALDRSESLVRARTESAVAGIDAPLCGSGEFPCGGLSQVYVDGVCYCMDPYAPPPELPQEQEFTIPVEGGARRLNLTLSSRNPVGDAWDPEVELIAPDGSSSNPKMYNAGGLARVLRLDYPAQGPWRLRIGAQSGTPQRSYFVAHVENTAPTCHVKALPRKTSSSSTPVRIEAEARMTGMVLDQGVTITGTVKRPDGGTVTVPFRRDTVAFPPKYVADFSQFAGRGAYTVRVNCDVANGATPVIGESIFAENPDGSLAPPSPDVQVDGFHREATATFFGDFPFDRGLTGRIGDDCDLDGILDDDEASGDTDGDELPDICDDDGDNDDLPDAQDPNPLVPDGFFPLRGCDSVQTCGGSRSVPVYGEDGVRLADSAEVRTPDSFGTVVAGQAAGLYLGVEAEVGDVWSEGSAELRNRAHVYGSLTAEGTVHREPDSIVDGAVGSADLTTPLLSGYQLAFPNGNLGSRSVEPDQALPLPPGAYGTVSVKSRSTLQLQAGTYYFDTLEVLEPQATLSVDTSAGPVFLIVRGALTYRGLLQTSTGRADQVFLGYFGTSTAVIENRFDGTLVAPRATVRLSPFEYHGAFFGKLVELQPGAVVHHVPFIGSWPAMPVGAPSCSDGLVNGAETGTDCGGPDCNACAEGQACVVDGDCLSGLCQGGVCGVASSVSATLAITADWSTGYCVQIAVSNTGAAPTSAWTVALGTPGTVINGGWNAEFTASGPEVLARSLSYNGALQPGVSTSFGFCAAKTSAYSTPVVLSTAAE